MRILASLTLTLVTFIAFAHHVTSPVLQAADSAVSILHLKDGQYMPYCSGAVVRLPQGNRIVTAGHCVDGEEGPIAVRDIHGNIYPARVEAFAHDYDARPQQDWAVLRSTAAYLMPALQLASEPLQVGDDVYAWSGPLGLDLLLFTGTYSGKFGYPTEQMPQGMDYLDLNGDGGSSGSVILNARGEAVGILVLGWLPQVKLDGVMISHLPPEYRED